MGFLLLLRSMATPKYEQGPLNIVGCRVITRAERADGQTAQGTTIPCGPNGPRVKSKKHLCQPLLWRHNEWESVSNHQPHDCLLNCLFGRRSKKTSKLRVTGLCAGNSSETGEFPAQRASNAENVSIWWRHHDNTKPGHHRLPQSACHNDFFACLKLLTFIT